MLKVLYIMNKNEIAEIQDVIGMLGDIEEHDVGGQGGYADDAGPDAPGPGETGYEDATGTLLTKGRTRELTFGREFHAGAGSASTV